MGHDLSSGTVSSGTGGTRPNHGQSRIENPPALIARSTYAFQVSAAVSENPMYVSAQTHIFDSKQASEINTDIPMLFSETVFS